GSGAVISSHSPPARQYPAWPASSARIPVIGFWLHHSWRSGLLQDHVRAPSPLRKGSLTYKRSPAAAVSALLRASVAGLQIHPSRASPNQGSQHPGVRARSSPELHSHCAPPPGSAMDGPAIRAECTVIGRCRPPATASSAALVW